LKTPIDDIFAKLTEEETAALLEGYEYGINEDKSEKKSRSTRFNLKRILAIACASVIGFALLTVTVTAAVPTVLPAVSEKIIPILRNLFASEEELINPWAEPIDSVAVVDEESTVFRLDKAVKSDDHIFIYYSIDSEKDFFGDLIGYEILRITTPEGDAIYHSEGNILAGELLCRTEQGGGLIHIKKPGGYTGDLTLSIQNLYSADSYLVTVENARDLSAYTETIADEVKIGFTLPELDNLEYTTLVEGKEFTIEGHRTIVDIRVSALTIEATFTLPDFEGGEHVANLLSGTTQQERNEITKKIDEEIAAGNEKAFYDYYRPTRMIYAQFYREPDGHRHDGWTGTSYLNDIGNSTTLTMYFEEPITSDDIENITYEYMSLADRYGNIREADYWGETIYLYGEPRKSTAE